MPFAAIVGGFLGACLIHFAALLILKQFGSLTDNDLFYDYIYPALDHIALGWLFVYFTYQVAPRHKIIAAVVMATLFGAYNLAMVIFALKFLPDEPHFSVGWTSLCTVASQIAAIFTVMNLHKQNPNNRVLSATQT